MSRLSTSLVSPSSLQSFPPHETQVQRREDGCLMVTILSAYDLPNREAPTSITLKCGSLPSPQPTPVRPPPSSSSSSSSSASSSGRLPARSRQLLPDVTSGPPTARHRDTNAFKFTERNTLEMIAPLSQLYRCHATLVVNYEPSSQRNGSDASSKVLQLQGHIPIHTLKIHETNWIILHLEPNNSNTISNNDTTTTALTTTTSTPTTIPTLRLQVQLMGPYRPEISVFLYLLQGWFRVVDPLANFVMQQRIQPTLSWLSSNHHTSHHPNNNHSTAPTLPPMTLSIMAVLLLITTPLWLTTIPVWLPLVMVLLTGSLVAAVGIGLLCLTSSSNIHGYVSPIINTLLSTSSGQRLVYQTGPRPTPVRLCRSLLLGSSFSTTVTSSSPSSLSSSLSDGQDGRSHDDHLFWYLLTLSLVIDAIGSSTYLIPILGETFDVVWAPLQTILIMAMYEREDIDEEYDNYDDKHDHNIRNNGTTAVRSSLSSSSSSWQGLKCLSFLEEILPFTDVIPSATIGWWIKFGPTILRQYPMLSNMENIFMMKNSTTTTSTSTNGTGRRQDGSNRSGVSVESSSSSLATTPMSATVTPYNTPVVTSSGTR